MITKIISGGQTGADRAALDFAIEFNLLHGGWIPEGRNDEDGIVPDKYHLWEMPFVSYPKRTEMNVLDADGTLILSHGKLTGGSLLTLRLAEQHGKPHLHFDLNYLADLRAVNHVGDWISEHDIEVLNVAGPRASKDPEIYEDTIDVLASLLHLGAFDEVVQGQPVTVEEAVKSLIDFLPFREKVEMARVPESELDAYHVALGRHIRNEFGLWAGNTRLKISCRELSGDNEITEDGCSAFIIRELWNELRRTHGLRAVRLRE